jgi:hypothetical protein
MTRRRDPSLRPVVGQFGWLVVRASRLRSAAETAAPQTDPLPLIRSLKPFSQRFLLDYFRQRGGQPLQFIEPARDRLGRSSAAFQRRQGTNRNRQQAGWVNVRRDRSLTTALCFGWFLVALRLMAVVIAGLDSRPLLIAALRGLSLRFFSLRRRRCIHQPRVAQRTLGWRSHLFLRRRRCTTNERLALCNAFGV